MTLYEWLINPKPNYTAGIELYKQFERNVNYIKYFNQVEDSEKGKPHFDMLHKQLARFVRIYPDKVKAVAVEAKKIGVTKIVIGKKTKKTAVKTEEPETPERKRIRIAGEFELVNPKDLSEELQKVFFDVKARFGNMKELHNKIKAAKNTDNVEALTIELTNLEEINYKEWGKIDAVLKDGKSEKKNLGGRSLLKEYSENERRINTLKINIPRAKKDLEKLGLEKDGCQDAKQLKLINKKIRTRNKSIGKWNVELKKLEARQIEIKKAE